MAIIKRPGLVSSPIGGQALRLTRADPALAAAVTKATPGRDGAAYDGRGNRRSALNDFYAFYSALTRRAQRNSDSIAVLKMLPDMELAVQILVSCILAPKDMMSVELIYTANSDDYHADLANTLIERLRKHFTDDYKIENKLSEMLREPLFEKGSYPVAVIPENAIDRVINGQGVAMESLNAFFNEDGSAKSIGILGSPLDAAGVNRKGRFGVSLEDFKPSSKVLSREECFLQYLDSNKNAPIFTSSFEEFVTVTDNPAALKIGQLVEFMKKRRVGNTYNTAMESVTVDKVTNVSDRLIERAMFSHKSQKQESVVEVPTQIQLSRKSVGNPLVIKLPSESVIPVHVPGNPERHIGYYIILDENGNPVYAPESDLLNPNTTNQTGGTAQSNLIQRAAVNMGMADVTKFDMHNHQHMQAAVRIYGEMVERDLINRIRNGSLGVNAVVARNDDIYRLMLSRTLARRYTQVLYLPVEYMTYIAFKYGSDGLGQSMLDDQGMISMLRATMLFADVIGSVKNSIGRTKVTGTIPENDPDPLSTVERITHEIVQSRKLNIPLGISNPADIMSFVQQAGFEFQWQGNLGLPDLKLEFENVSTQFQKPDNDLSDKLRKASIMGFGLSPETVDNGFNTEFATTAVANNVLLSKRVIMWQNIFAPQLTNHMRQHARFSEKLIVDLKEILEKNKDKILLEVKAHEGTELSDELKEKLKVDYALRKFLDTFVVSLPQPSSVTLKAQLEELKDYAEALDVALDAYIAPEMFTETTSGMISEQIGTLKAMFKAYFLRKWMSEKGILTEVGELTSVDDQGKPQTAIVDEIKAHIQSLSKAGVLAMVQLVANKQANNEDLKKIGATPGPDASSSLSGGGFGGSSGSTDFSSDLGGGLGDLGGGLDDLGGFDLGGSTETDTETAGADEQSDTGADDVTKPESDAGGSEKKLEGE